MSQAPLHIAVIQGGSSAEASVSRVSAQGVATALSAAGHRVQTLELDTSLPSKLLAERFDVVFPVAHGSFGEDGCLQGLLEILGLPYVGSDVLASAVAANKAMAKRLFALAGLPVAEDTLVHRGEDLVQAAARVRSSLGKAVAVKPCAQGSAIGVSLVRANAPDADLVRALEDALALDPVALCERLVEGRELTCGVLDSPSFGPARALPPTEIRAKAGDFYDFQSKYAQGGSDHLCPAPIDAALEARIQSIAVAAHRALGCRDLSRADLLVGNDGTVVLLEVNTLPGMTPLSLYPEAAKVAGISMEALVDGLARGAHRRGPRQGAQALAMP